MNESMSSTPEASVWSSRRMEWRQHPNTRFSKTDRHRHTNIQATGCPNWPKPNTAARSIPLEPPIREEPPRGIPSRKDRGQAPLIPLEGVEPLTNSNPKKQNLHMGPAPPVPVRKSTKKPHPGLPEAANRHPERSKPRKRKIHPLIH